MEDLIESYDDYSAQLSRSETGNVRVRGPMMSTIKDMKTKAGNDLLSLRSRLMLSLWDGVKLITLT